MSQLLTWILCIVMLAVGLVFGAVMLVVGLLLALGLVLWSLLRGRKPQAVRFRMNSGAPFGPLGPFGAAGGPAVRPGAGHPDVVDIEAREVPDTPTPLPRERG